MNISKGITAKFTALRNRLTNRSRENAAHHDRSAGSEGDVGGRYEIISGGGNERIANPYTRSSNVHEQSGGLYAELRHHTEPRSHARLAGSISSYERPGDAESQEVSSSGGARAASPGARAIDPLPPSQFREIYSHLDLQENVLKPLSLEDGSVGLLRWNSCTSSEGTNEEKNVPRWLNILAGTEENSMLARVLLDRMYQKAICNGNAAPMVGGEISDFVSAVDDFKLEILSLVQHPNGFGTGESVSDLSRALTVFKEKVSAILDNDNNFSDETSADRYKVSFSHSSRDALKNIDDRLGNAIRTLQEVKYTSVQRDEVLKALSLGYGDKGLVALEKDNLIAWLNAFAEGAKDKPLIGELVMKDMYEKAVNNNGNLPMPGGDVSDFDSLVDELGPTIWLLVKDPTRFTNDEVVLPRFLDVMVRLQEKVNKIAADDRNYADDLASRDGTKMYVPSNLRSEFNKFNDNLLEAISGIRRLIGTPGD